MLHILLRIEYMNGEIYLYMFHYYILNIINNDVRAKLSRECWKKFINFSTKRNPWKCQTFHILSRNRRPISSQTRGANNRREKKNNEREKERRTHGNDVSCGKRTGSKVCRGRSIRRRWRGDSPARPGRAWTTSTTIPCGSHDAHARALTHMYAHAGTPARILFGEFDRPVDPWGDSRHRVTPRHNSRLVRARARGGHSSLPWPAFFLFLRRVSVSHSRVFASPFVFFLLLFFFFFLFSLAPLLFIVALAHCHTRARAPSRGTTPPKLTCLPSLPSLLFVSSLPLRALWKGTFFVENIELTHPQNRQRTLATDRSAKRMRATSRTYDAHARARRREIWPIRKAEESLFASSCYRSISHCFLVRVYFFRFFYSQGW